MENQDYYIDAIRSLITAIEAKAGMDLSHTHNVERLSLALAEKLDLPEIELEGLRMAAIMHDIGKLGVPEHIRMKPGTLNPVELARVQGHSALGQRILAGIRFPWPIQAMIRSHHERWDGTGYPDGLKGAEIPIGARILCVADVYEAMTSHRPYRDGISPEDAVKYIQCTAGSHFDPAVASALGELAVEGRLPEIGERGTPSEDPSEVISKANSEFIAMFEIAQAASTSLNPDEMIPLLAAKIKKIIPCSLCMIFLADKSGEMVAQGDDSRALKTLGRELASIVATTREGAITETSGNYKSAMAVPIICDDAVLGTINLYHRKPDAFSGESYRLFSSVAAQAGRAIHNALLFAHTKESALTDGLTGLSNARYLLVHMEQEVSRAKRLGKPVSVLGLDLDNFKAVNDTFGHPHGDTVLKEFSQLLLAQVRSYDLVARCAGDEFIIVLPDTSRSEADETASRIKNALDACRLCRVGDKEVHIGVSIGIAAFPEDGNEVRTLIARADERMYSDKRAGKTAA
ncbi:MAG: sensor domain-containing diguanylate cyclase/phosphohydrolase [Armatimonadota bacterium]